MQAKSMIISAGLGMVAGAAAILMIPKHSEVYRMADDAAHTLKQEAGRMLDSMRRN